MTVYRTEREERMLEQDTLQRAHSASVPEPERKQEETRDEYHARIWAAICQTSQS